MIRKFSKAIGGFAGVGLGSAVGLTSLLAEWIAAALIHLPQMTEAGAQRIADPLALAIIAGVSVYVSPRNVSADDALHVKLSRTTSLILAGLLVLPSAGCIRPQFDPTPTTPSVVTLPPEGQIAHQARQVIAAAQTALQGVETLESGGVLARSEAIAAVTAIREVGVLGQQLAEVLALVEQTRGEARDSHLQAAVSLLQRVTRAVQTIPLQPAAEPARAALSDHLAPITEAAVLLAALLGGLR